MELQEKINHYLSGCLVGKGAMSDEILDKIGDRVKETMRIQFNEGEREFRMSMSSKFAYGYLTEALVMAIMEAAGVNIEEFQTEVEVDLGGEAPLHGTLDVVIDGKVYDIKSVSSTGYTTTYSRDDGFSRLVEDDPFGYLAQGYLYGVGRGLPFGGWIALNKETGEIAVLTTPRDGDEGDKFEKAAIAEASRNVAALESDEPFKRCFEPVDDEYGSGKIKTGNKILHTRCSYCPYKHTCWGDKIAWKRRGSITQKNGKKVSIKSMRWMFV
jgi:hypothetical protein